MAIHSKTTLPGYHVAGNLVGDSPLDEQDPLLPAAMAYHNASAPRTNRILKRSGLTLPAASEAAVKTGTEVPDPTVTGTAAGAKEGMTETRDVGEALENARDFTQDTVEDATAARRFENQGGVAGALKRSSPEQVQRQRIIGDQIKRENLHNAAAWTAGQIALAGDITPTGIDVELIGNLISGAGWSWGLRASGVAVGVGG
jgi:hypothetical protein